MLKVNSLMADPTGRKGPIGSRDFWNVELKCSALECICNNGKGTCAVSSLAVIGKGGKCTGYQTAGKEKK